MSHGQFVPAPTVPLQFKNTCEGYCLQYVMPGRMSVAWFDNGTIGIGIMTMYQSSLTVLWQCIPLPIRGSLLPIENNAGRLKAFCFL
jgi:hypothetical protein